MPGKLTVPLQPCLTISNQRGLLDSNLVGLGLREFGRNPHQENRGRKNPTFPGQGHYVGRFYHVDGRRWYQKRSLPWSNGGYKAFQGWKTKYLSMMLHATILHLPGHLTTKMFTFDLSGTPLFELTDLLRGEIIREILAYKKKSL